MISKRLILSAFRLIHVNTNTNLFFNPYIHGKGSESQYIYMWTHINLPIFNIWPLTVSTPLWHISYSSARHSVEKWQYVCHIIINALIHGQVRVRKKKFWPTFHLINVTILTFIYSWWRKNPNSIIAKLIFDFEVYPQPLIYQRDFFVRDIQFFVQRNIKIRQIVAFNF